MSRILVVTDFLVLCRRLAVTCVCSGMSVVPMPVRRQEACARGWWWLRGVTWKMRRRNESCRQKGVVEKGENVKPHQWVRWDILCSTPGRSWWLSVCFVLFFCVRYISVISLCCCCFWFVMMPGHLGCVLDMTTTFCKVPNNRIILSPRMALGKVVAWKVVGRHTTSVPTGTLSKKKEPNNLKKKLCSHVFQYSNVTFQYESCSFYSHSS